MCSSRSPDQSRVERQTIQVARYSYFEEVERYLYLLDDGTPKGKKVTVRAELLDVDGRKLRFKVEAHDEDKKVGEGTHRRDIVAIQRKE